MADPGGIDADPTLSDQQRQIAEAAHEFAQAEIAPRAREMDRGGELDLAIVRRLGELGYLGAPVAPEFGGRGLDYVAYSLIVEAIGRADSSIRTAVSVQTSLVCGAIERWGSNEQRARWLPELCSGELIGCFGLTEPGAGSDPASLRTRAVAQDDQWRLSGEKHFISLGKVADVAIVFARSEDEPGPRGISAFIVPCDTAGFTATPVEGRMGLRASGTASLALDSVEVGESGLLGERGHGLKVALSSLESGRLSVAAGCAGICAGCVSASVAYATEREQFGVPIGSFQLVQARIAEMVVRRDASRALVRRAARARDERGRAGVETSVAKLYATEAAVDSANDAIQVHGGAGYVDDHPVERYLRDARATTLYEGTSEIQRLIIGRDATGLDALRPA